MPDDALAAGVGVPPDKDSVSAPARERQDARGETTIVGGDDEAASRTEVALRPSLAADVNAEAVPGVVRTRMGLSGLSEADSAEHDRPADHLPAARRADAAGPVQGSAAALASGASAAEGRKPNPAENLPAGVGEARPAEPGDRVRKAFDDADAKLAEEQPDARVKAEALLDGFGGRLERPSNLFETYARDCARHVVALTKERDGLREQLDAARQALEAAQELVDLPFPPVNSDERNEWRGCIGALRAALGDVAAPPDQATDSVSAPAKGAGRAGDKEA